MWRVAVAEPSALESADSVLSDDERDRAARFVFEADRQRFALTRASLRRLLATYLARSARELAFEYGPAGKPSLPQARIRFNVAHSGRLALLAFALEREVGVDIEEQRVLRDAIGLAKRFFAPGEQRVLSSMPAAEVVPAFLRCWTRKEAFIKATGDGLSHPLDTFEVAFAREQEPDQLLRVEEASSPEACFHLASFSPGHGFTGAVCVEGRVSRIALYSLDEAERTSSADTRAIRAGA